MDSSCPYIGRYVDGVENMTVQSGGFDSGFDDLNSDSLAALVGQWTVWLSLQGNASS